MLLFLFFGKSLRLICMFQWKDEELSLILSMYL